MQIKYVYMDIQFIYNDVNINRYEMEHTCLSDMISYTMGKGICGMGVGGHDGIRRGTDKGEKYGC